MEKGKVRFRSGYSLIHQSVLDEKLSSGSRPEDVARRARHWKKNGVSLLVLAPAAEWIGSDILAGWHRVCREEGLPLVSVSPASLEKKDFLYYRRLNQEIRGALGKGHVLFLYSSAVESAVRTYLPTLLIHPVEILPDRAVEAFENALQPGHSPEGREAIRKVVRDYARSIHPYLPDASRRTGQTPRKRSLLTIRFKLLTIITLVVFFSSMITIFVTTDLFRRLSSVLIQDYNLGLSRMIGQTVDTELDSILSWSRLYAAGEEKSAQFFERNPSVIGVSILRSSASPDKKEPVIEQAAFNPVTSREYSLDQAWVQDFLKKEAGIEMVGQTLELPRYLNLRVNERISLLAVSFRHDEDHVLLLFLSPEKLMENFRLGRLTGVFQLLLVDGAGRLVSSDNASSTAGIVVEDLPIVQAMLRSPADNGSRIFSYKNTEYLGSFQILKGSGFGVISIIPADRAFEAVLRVQRENLLILVLILTGAFVIVYLFSRTLSLPIVDLLHAARQIEDGNYAVSIRPTTRDEIGDLTRAFVDMAEGLRERQIIKEEFGKFVDPGIAERAIQGSLRLGGEKKICTVLFVDLRNFTAFAESRQPEEVVDFLNRYFTEMVDCVTITEGVVDKFIGDALMAHWGALVPQKDEARRSVNAALLMRRSLLDLNRMFAAEGIPHMRFGLGINTGPVIAGQVGSHKRLEFTAIGDAVNLASRIEYLNKEFGTDILISDSTLKLLGDGYRVLAMPSIHIRGKTELQKTYAVLGREDDPDAPRTLKQLREMMGIEWHEGMPVDGEPS